MPGMDTIDEIREALGAPSPRNGGRPGDKRPGASRRAIPPSVQVTVFSEACTSLSRGRVPGRGLLYSFLFHEIAVFLLLMHPGYSTIPVKNLRRPVDEPLFIDAELLKADLPPVGGGEAGGSEGKKKGSPGKKGDARPGSQGHKGFMYPGPQPIVSKPPAPDNPIQTIRQPDLVNPPPIKFEVKLPNQIQIAAPKLPDAPKLKGTMRPVNLSVHVPPAPPEVKPKLTLPPPKPEIAALPTDIRKDLAQTAPKLSAPKPPPPKVLPSSGDQLRNLAVLSPIGRHTTEIAEIPVGERRGAFAIGPALAGAKTSEVGAGTGDAPGAGSATTPSSAEGGGAGSGDAANGKGTSAGSGLEPGNGSGTGSASGTGEGRNGLGAGSGGSGTGKGSGAGAGLGPGKGPFTGLSVDGGTGSGGSIPRTTGLRLVFGPNKPYSYGMSVEAQGPSGGLRDYGIFRDDVSYTVYIDMSQPNDRPTSWTLQYSVMNAAASSTVVTLKKAKAVSESTEEHVLPPIPANTVDPKLPPQVAKQYPGHMIVVYAEISREGKLQKIHVVESPDIELTQLVLQALVKWAFKPALENGQPVAVRALFGVPLAPPEKAVDHKPVPPVDHKPVPPMVHKPAPPPLISQKHAPEVRALTLNPNAPERTVTLNPNASGRAVTLDPNASGRAVTLKPAAPGAQKPVSPPPAASKHAGQKPEERSLTLK